MDTLKRRLKYYGLGFGLGLIFVIFFFQNRGCSWLPDNRVKNAILERMIVVPESQAEALKKRGFDKDMAMLFLNKGSVDFGDSEKTGPNKRYKIDYEDQSLYFTLPEEGFVSAVFASPVDRSKERIGRAKSIHLPKDDNFVYIDSSDLLACQLTGMGLKNAKEILAQIKLGATMDYDSSRFVDVSKPIHRIVTSNKNGKELAFDAIWYKNKINITKFIYTDSLPCN